jgi:hypothetical protein
MSEWTEYDELAKMGDALKELREENQRLREWVSMFTLEDLQGMFNHYMEMQKQAWDGGSDELTRNFWHNQAKKQREIIEAFEALEYDKSS